MVFKRLEAANLKVKTEKCQMFHTGMHVVSEEGVEMLQEKIVAVQSWQVPTTVSDLRRFLGLAGLLEFRTDRWPATYSAVAILLKRPGKGSYPSPWYNNSQPYFFVALGSLE